MVRCSNTIEIHVTTANDFFNNKAGVFAANDPQVLSGTALAGAPRFPVRHLLRTSLEDSLGWSSNKGPGFLFLCIRRIS
jgi:hypothetical protein